MTNQQAGSTSIPLTLLQRTVFIIGVQSLPPASFAAIQVGLALMGVLDFTERERERYEIKTLPNGWAIPPQHHATETTVVIPDRARGLISSLFSDNAQVWPMALAKEAQSLYEALKSKGLVQ